MICINCFHENTRVINSRAKKKQPSIWRRRQCENCKATFTTYEYPSADDRLPIINKEGVATPFNLGKLLLSIAASFSHAPDRAETDALWLAQTVEDSLYARRESHYSSDDVRQVTHEVLKRYDELVGLQYAARHKLISSVRRRGRPSLVSHEPPTPPSPSR